MVDDIGCHEIGIASADPGTTEVHGGLRHIELDHDAPAKPLRDGRRDRLEHRFGGEPTKSAIEQLSGGFSIDVADQSDLEIAARKHTAGVGSEIINGDMRQ